MLGTALYTFLTCRLFLSYGHHAAWIREVLLYIYLVYIFIIYLVYTPIVFPIEQHDQYFPIFDGPYLIAHRAYPA